MKVLVLVVAAALLMTACTPFRSPHVNHSSAEQPRTSSYGGHSY